MLYYEPMIRIHSTLVGFLCFDTWLFQFEVNFDELSRQTFCLKFQMLQFSSSSKASRNHCLPTLYRVARHYMDKWQFDLLLPSSRSKQNRTAGLSNPNVSSHVNHWRLFCSASCQPGWYHFWIPRHRSEYSTFPHYMFCSTNCDYPWGFI